MAKHVLMEQTGAPKTDIGLPAAARQSIADGLAQVLAETYTLYLKTHNYHWNVTGPMFPVLHDTFEQQYRALWAAVDEVAERLRAIGAVVPGTSAAFTRLSGVEEDEEGEAPPAQRMLENLLDGHAALVRTIREQFGLVQENEDEATYDLLIRRLAEHEKTVWMLRSMLA